MNKNKKRLQKSQYISIILFSLFFSVLSCSEDENIIGENILPNGDEITIGFNEISTIESYTVSMDSIYSDEDELSSSKPYCLVGSYIDPVFGLSKASFMSQIRLSKNNVDFGDDFVVDSLILQLNLTNIYGEERQGVSHEISIYQLTDSIMKDSSYMSDMDVSGYYDSSLPLASFTYTPSYQDTILSIPLNIEVFEQILSDTLNLVDNTSFNMAFMGFYMTSTTVDFQGSILSFNLLSETSKLTLHYRNNEFSESPIIQSSSHHTFDFLINEKCARINFFEHDFSLAQNPIPNIDVHVVDDTLIYVQAMAGLKAKITIPDILNISQLENIIISSARLFVPILAGSLNDFQPPASLSLRNIENDGNEDFFPDLLTNGSYYNEYFNGIYDSEKVGYEFNIAQYIQKVLEGEIQNNGFYITNYSPSNVSTPNRVILKGGNAQDGIKLYISFIEL